MILFREKTLQTIPYYDLVNRSAGTFYQWFYEGKAISLQIGGFNATCRWITEQSKYLPSKCELFKILPKYDMGILMNIDYQDLDSYVLANRIVAIPS